MAGSTFRFKRGLILAILGVFCATSLIPTVTSADTNLVIGGQAVIAYANGDQVRLRQDIGYDSSVIANYSEGTWLTVLDGPFTDDDGAYWYQVSIGDPSAGGQSGYMVADYLALEGGVPLETVAAVEEEAVQTETSAPAAGAVIGTAYVAGTNGDGVRCRAGADPASAVITVLPEATLIELTGAPVDIWQPVNCAGSGGYVSLEFVSYEPPVADPAPVVPDETTTEETGEGEATPPPSAVVTGSLVVTGTNGDGVRCRADAGLDGNVITVLAEGMSVDLAGAVQGDWQPVFCAGVNGYVWAAFLGSGAADDTGDDPATEEEAAAVTTADVGGPSGMGMITGTNGDGVRCRSGASTSTSTIMVLPEGADVMLRGGVQGDWQPVICANQNGFVYALYVTAGGSSGDDGSENENPAPSEAAATGTARVDSTGGLNCRTGGGLSFSVITVLANNSTVTLRSGSTSGWQAVICAGQNGFASSTYLDFDTGSGTDGSSEEPPSGSDGSSGGFSTGSLVTVTGTAGGGLRLRSAASYSGTVLSVIGEGASATVRNGSTGDWIAVTYNGTNGFVHADYVEAGGGGSTPNVPTPTNPSPTTSLSNGDHARVTDSLNLRYEASYSSGVAAVAPAGTVVLITGGPSNGFYPMNWDGLRGYMHGDYLDETTAALSERGGSASPGTTPGGTDSGTGAGNNIVDYAMRYLGYPYVWATAGPGSFDCSGFINWVVKNVMGRDIGRGLFTQVAAGGAVSRSELQPGDLVFFQNTYTTGLSHGGIYIGNNQFIHAENPSTGVRISDLNSNYYSSRWYGAVRL